MKTGKTNIKLLFKVMKFMNNYNLTKLGKKIFL